MTSVTSHYGRCVFVLVRVHLVFVLRQMDVVQVSSESRRLQAQPAFIHPRVQFLTVMEEFKQPQLNLQLSPPGRGEERRESGMTRRRRVEERVMCQR